MKLVNLKTAPDRVQVQELRDRGKRFQLARVLNVTATMLQHANDGHWDKVAEMESLRRLELEECFNMQNTYPNELIAEALANLIYLNEQLVELVRFARDKLEESRNDYTVRMLAARTYEESE